MEKMRHRKKSNRYKAPKQPQLKSKGFFRTHKEADEALKKSNLKKYTVLEVTRQKKTMKRYCIGRYI
jgi:hypothetical protein